MVWWRRRTDQQMRLVDSVVLEEKTYLEENNVSGNTKKICKKTLCNVLLSLQRAAQFAISSLSNNSATTLTLGHHRKR